MTTKIKNKSKFHTYHERVSTTEIHPTGRFEHVPFNLSKKIPRAQADNQLNATGGRRDNSLNFNIKL